MTSQVEVVQLSEAAELSKIMSSETAKLVVDYIAQHEDCTAGEIVKQLKIPASTVHYNLKALTKANILDDSHFTYSAKGKTVVNYRLAKKVIIIVPEKESKSTLLSQLNAILPGLLGVAILVGVGFFTSLFRAGSGKAMDANILQEALPLTAAKSPTVLDELVAEYAVPASGAAQAPVQDTLVQTTQTVASRGFFSSDLLVGLLIGAGIIVLGAVIFILVRRHRQRS